MHDKFAEVHAWAMKQQTCCDSSIDKLHHVMQQALYFKYYDV